MAPMMFLDSPTAVGISNMFLQKDLFPPSNPRFSRAGISPETSKFSPGSRTPISPVKVPGSGLGQIPERLIKPLSLTQPARVCRKQHLHGTHSSLFPLHTLSLLCLSPPLLPLVSGRASPCSLCYGSQRSVRTLN